MSPTSCPFFCQHIQHRFRAYGVGRQPFQEVFDINTPRCSSLSKPSKPCASASANSANHSLGNYCGNPLPKYQVSNFSPGAMIQVTQCSTECVCHRVYLTFILRLSSRETPTFQDINSFHSLHGIVSRSSEMLLNLNLKHPICKL